jgi:magnesium transporter
VSNWVYSANQWHEVEPDQLADALTLPDSFAWIELTGIDQPFLHQLGSLLDLHELALEDAIAARQRPKIEEYPNGGLFMVMRTAKEWQGNVEYGETHVFLDHRYIVIIRHGPGSGYRHALERLKSGRFTPSPGSALYVVLDQVVDAYRPVTEQLGERYDSYEATLLETHVAEQNLARLYSLKREALLLAQTLEPMSDMVQELIRMHPEVIGKGLKAYYRDVHDHLTRHNRDLYQIREMLTDAMHVSLASLSLRQNESVQKLAGWGAILAVPTLVFSLYGMNFKVMPELNWPVGYPVVLTLTAGACFVLYRHLKKRGWI